MSEPKQFRTRTIMVSNGVFEALKAVADAEGMDCPDAVADLKLGLLLSSEADLLWFVKERKRVLDELSKEYRRRLTGKNDQCQATAHS